MVFVFIPPFPFVPLFSFICFLCSIRNFYLHLLYLYSNFMRTLNYSLFLVVIFLPTNLVDMYIVTSLCCILCCCRIRFPTFFLVNLVCSPIFNFVFVWRNIFVFVWISKGECNIQVVLSWNCEDPGGISTGNFRISRVQPGFNQGSTRFQPASTRFQPGSTWFNQVSTRFQPGSTGFNQATIWIRHGLGQATARFNKNSRRCSCVQPGFNLTGESPQLCLLLLAAWLHACYYLWRYASSCLNESFLVW